MKIAQVVATFPPSIGGMGEVCFNESEQLTKNGHEVTVFTLKHLNSKQYDDASFGFKVIRLSSILKSGDAGVVPQLFSKLRGFDYVHLHYPFYGGAEWVWLACKIFGIPLIVTYHMDAEPVGKFKKTIQLMWDGLFAKAIFRKAKKVVTVDMKHLMDTKFGNYIFADKLVEIFNGVDTNIFVPQKNFDYPASLSGWENKKIFLFVGNPLPFKRLDFLLEAFKNIVDPQCVLAIVSGGYEIERYKKLAFDFGFNSDRVRFVGRAKDKAELNQYFQVAQALVVSSLGAAESFALVSIEALSAGCPVIASNIPGVASRINNGVDGLLFEPLSRESLLEKIIEMANFSRQWRDAMGEAGRSKITKIYSWEKHGNELNKLFVK
jgi:glycosyltransferase involved in cell wall biosynthesis